MTTATTTPMSALIGTITIMMIIGILPAGSQYIKAESGFIANPTNTTKPADTNYNTYQNIALGFSIKYLKNMTITQLQNGSGNTLIHYVSFHTHIRDKLFKEHIAILITIIPETNFLGQQYNLDQTVRNALMNYYSGNDTVVTNKTKGILNGLPAYKIESTVLVPKVLKNVTSSLGFDGKPIIYQYRTTYVTFKDGIGYWIEFFTYSPDRFNPVEKTMIDSFRYN
jgi:hypothetical protein